MLFNSIAFLFFFVAVYLIYLPLPLRPQNLLLLAASYFFYAQWDWRFVSLILLSTGVDYVIALAIERHRDSPKAKHLLYLSLSVNLGVLGVFKYYDFFVGSLELLLARVGLNFSPTLLGIAVPVGISFYTFQTLSYTIDVYRGRLKPCRDLTAFALFVALFPQLVAGPIERATNLLPQILRARQVTLHRALSGAQLMGWGLFKKVVIADNLALLVVDPIFDPALNLGGLVVLLGTYAFALQIYCDFSGYSDIAIGCARMLGIDFGPNFNLPYVATSPSDFWRRWHISLSSWLRDYLYIGLGGNRTGRTMRNLMVTMLLGGLWHGASWKFVLWGAFHGLLLIVYKQAGQWRWTQQVSSGLRWFVMFHLTCLGWLIFRARDVEHFADLVRSFIQDFFIINDPDGTLTAHFVFFAGPLIVLQILQHKFGVGLARRLPWPIQGALYCILFYTFITFGEFGGNEFIYFQF